MSEEVILQIDDILRNVGAPSLKTSEIALIEKQERPVETEQNLFDIAVYIIQIRNVYGSYYTKLNNYAMANGLEFSQPKKTGFSNVFLGAPLE